MGAFFVFAGIEINVAKRRHVVRMEEESTEQVQLLCSTQEKVNRHTLLLNEGARASLVMTTKSERLWLRCSRKYGALVKSFGLSAMTLMNEKKAVDFSVNGDVYANLINLRLSLDVKFSSGHSRVRGKNSYILMPRNAVRTNLHLMQNSTRNYLSKLRLSSDN